MGLLFIHLSETSEYNGAGQAKHKKVPFQHFHKIFLFLFYKDYY